MNDGGPAFPVQTYDTILAGQVVRATDYGMSLRDYFAAKVLQARISKTPIHTHETEKKKDECVQLTARLCYEMADAMIAERSRNAP
jgi:hypothetical protein